MARTGCDGVVIGRGCLGQPWLFAELSAEFSGTRAPAPPSLGRSPTSSRRHGAPAERPFQRGQGHARHPQAHRPGTCTVSSGPDLRRALALVTTRANSTACSTNSTDIPTFRRGMGPAKGAWARRPRSRPCPLEGWLDDPDDCAVRRSAPT
ncbi:tRNA-dihydrouridine synthase [Mycolicibacterium sp.]|uniref:tRNA-dihydrouridine synthase n=1 Tax=Mycolicibacterium sp. TaxID=2320850 RepID=UPI0034563C59